MQCDFSVGRLQLLTAVMEVGPGLGIRPLTEANVLSNYNIADT